jgi:hypothetical protein
MLSMPCGKLISKCDMNYTDKRIVESYSSLFEGLSSMSKLELIETLSKSLRAEKKTKDVSFYKSFGAFASEKKAEEIIKDIKENRRFRRKTIKL